MSAYYNENDPFAAAWLRELIKAGHIAHGEVDERSIADVRPADVRGFTQCHFFAGIGGWSYALRIAGWPDSREVWTGSCPCQPFSSAGTQAGGHDSRDLWPTWFQFIKECRPCVVFGEQVEAAIGHGWLDRVCDDMEQEDYAIGPVSLPGPCVGAFDIRQRLWFVAESESERTLGLSVRRRGSCEAESDTERGSEVGALDNAERERAGRSAGSEGRAECTASSDGKNERSRIIQTLNAGAISELGHTHQQGSRIGAAGVGGMEHATCEQAGISRRARQQRSPYFWSDAEWIACLDGKTRPIEPGTFPLASGIPNRVGRLRGYGNAIKPEVAAVLIEAYLDISG